MSEARTIWETRESRTVSAATRERGGIVIAIGLLAAIAAGEVLFLNFVAGPDSVNMLSAAEGIPVAE